MLHRRQSSYGLHNAHGGIVLMQSIAQQWRLMMRIVLIGMTLFIAISPFIIYLPRIETIGEGNRFVDVQLQNVQEYITVSSTEISKMVNCISFMPTEKVSTSEAGIRSGIPNSGHFYEKDIPYLYESVPQMVSRHRAMKRRGKNTIFVSIASYRDRRCSETVADLFAKCKFCDRIYVGIADQIEEKDQKCLPPSQFENQVSIIEVPASQSKGPCFGRFLAAQLFAGEQFFMQIDAHSLFLSNWDEELLSMVPVMPSPRFVITVYPIGELDQFEKTHPVPWICKVVYEAALKGLFHHGSQWFHIAQNSGIVQASPYLAAGFWFAPSEVILDVPFDRYLDWVFNGEEFLLAIRMWTSGWELVVPTRNLVYHYYGSRNHSVFSTPHNQEPGNRRVRYLTQVSSLYPSDADAELEYLGMGRERTVQEYEKFAGLNLKAHNQTHHCEQVFDWNSRQWLSNGSKRRLPLNRPLPDRHH